MLQIAEQKRVGIRRGERTREAVQHRVQHCTPPTLISMATASLERVIMQLPLFLFCKLFNWYHMQCEACGRQSLPYPVVGDDYRNVWKYQCFKNTTS